jgi:GcrA cell cycle regulator
MADSPAWMTYPALANLRAWWDDGVPTSEIGRRLGVSKNCIVSKSHQMKMEPRPSPLIRRVCDWTEDEITQLQALRRTTATWVMIAETLGKTVDSTRSKDRALQAADIRRNAANVPRPSLAPALTSEVPEIEAPLPPIPAPIPRIAKRPVFIQPVRPVVIQEPCYIGKVEPCCWVTTEGGKGKPWLYCDVDSVPGKPYCPTHTKRAYQPKRADAVHAQHAAMGGD